MLVHAQAIDALLRALDQLGHSSDAVLAKVGLDRAVVESATGRIPWSTFVRTCDAAGEVVGGDVTELHRIGAELVGGAAQPPLKALARSVVSPHKLYDLATRWVVPANFPHFRLFLKFGARGHLSLHGVIPAAFEPCAAFLHIGSGSVVALPTMLGLPPAVVVERLVTERTVDLELELPKRKRTVGDLLRTVARRKDRTEVLEMQRLALIDALSASRRASDELRAVLEHLPDMVVIHVAGRVVFVNRAFVRTMGWSSELEVIGRPLVELVDPRSRALFLARAAAPVDAPTVPDLTEAWLLHREGEPVRVEISPTQLVVFEGVTARVVVGRDIGERERLQQRLVTADRLASLGLLAAGVAHEVNNPLAYILNNIEIAKRQLSRIGGEGDTAREALQVALEGVDRIRFIVRELLQLSRAEMAASESSNLADVVASTLALATIEIQRTARLKVEVEEAPPVRGSVPRLAQIVLNLVLNALDAMRGRDPSSNELVVRVAPSGKSRVLLAVFDNGTGVRPSDMGRVFDPFFTTKPAGTGTGLGLSITERLVSDLGGEIAFASEPGRGTVFRVLFAVAEEARAASAPPS